MRGRVTCLNKKNDSILWWVHFASPHEIVFFFPSYFFSTPLCFDDCLSLLSPALRWLVWIKKEGGMIIIFCQGLTFNGLLLPGFIKALALRSILCKEGETPFHSLLQAMYILHFILVPLLEEQKKSNETFQTLTYKYGPFLLSYPGQEEN